MKQKKTIWLVGALALFAAAVGWKVLLRFEDQTKIPMLLPRLAEVNVSSEFLNAERSVGYYREEIRKHPDVVKNYVQLAQLFLQEIRVTGNEVDYVPRARYLLDEALRRDPNNFEALINKASLMLTLHQFEEGKKFAEQALLQNPYSAFAYGELVDALVELGEYGSAVQASDKMLSLRPDLRSYARASYLRELYGNNPGAIEAMELAANAGMHGQENRAWVLYNLGNLYLQQGNLDVARYVYSGILEERPSYAYALSGLAQVQSAKEDFAGAINLLNEAYKILPSHHFLEQLVDVYWLSGDHASAQPLIEKVFDIYKQDKSFGADPDLEYATFCANHNLRLEKALESIQREYARRPNNIQVLEIYAWILLKQGKAGDALPLIERAMRLKTRRADLFYRAGLIYNSAGSVEQARTYLTRALNSKGYLDILKRQEVQRVLSSLQPLASIK